MSFWTPSPLTYSLSSRLWVILGAQEISGLVFHLLGGLLGDFITPWDDLDSSVLAEYKNWEVNRKTPLLEVKYCHSWLSPKELYTFGKWRRRFGLPSPPGCVAVFPFIYRFGPHVPCVYQGLFLESHVYPCRQLDKVFLCSKFLLKHFQEYTQVGSLRNRYTKSLFLFMC